MDEMCNWVKDGVGRRGSAMVHARLEQVYSNTSLCNDSDESICEEIILSCCHILVCTFLFLPSFPDFPCCSNEEMSS